MVVVIITIVTMVLIDTAWVIVGLGTDIAVVHIGSHIITIVITGGTIKVIAGTIGGNKLKTEGDREY